MTDFLHPIVLLAVFAAIIAFGAGTFALFSRRLGLRIILSMIALICVLPALCILFMLFPELVDARFRAYKGFYSDISEGMTRGDVLATMERHYPLSGPRQRPKIMEDEATELGFFMSPEKSDEPNCEGIFLTLRDGRVIGKVYSAD